MNKKNWILIYNDAGTSKLSVDETINSLNAIVNLNNYQIKRADKNLINHSDWEQHTALFIMPGGRSRPFYQDLATGGNEKIRNYVNNGGNYLGICAGGYYGCRKTEFEIGQALEIRAEGILNFFSGSAWGPAYGLGQFNYDNNNGARAAQIILTDDITNKYSVYFNGGAYFIFPENKDSNTTVIANYADIENNPPAIISCSVGKGTAILTGVHPEYSYRAVEQQEYVDANIFPVLRNTETERLALFAKLIGYFNDIL